MFEGYTLDFAQATAGFAIRKVTTGEWTAEQAISYAVAKTVRDFQNVLEQVQNCCHCGHADENEELIDTAAKLQKQYEHVTV